MTSRRTFLGAAAGSVAASIPVPAQAAATRLRLGGPIFLKSEDPVELAREHRRLGYRAAYCPNVKADDSARIGAIERAFGAEEVVIAEVGAWVNLMDQDPAKRKSNLAFVTERLALADAVGALNCVDIAGSMNPKQWDGPDPKNYSREFFDATVENVRAIVDAVKPRRSKFSLEMMPWLPPDGPDGYLRLLHAVDRPAFGVHIDVCNIVNSTQRFFHNGELITETFQKLGKWVLSCHAKDLWGYRVHLAETVPGRGGIDYAAYLRSIATYSPNAPLMLEHLSKPEEYDEGREYVLRIGRQVGISFA